MSVESEKIKEFRDRFGPPAVRQTEAVIQRRRQQVWEMFMERVPQTTMAKVLGVSRVTIYSDLDYMRKQMTSQAHDIKHDYSAAELDIGTTIKELESIAGKAMAEYAQAESAQDKDRFLNTAMKAYMCRNRVLVETGFLPKAGIDIKQSVEHTISFEERFGKLKVMDDPNSRRKVLAVVEAALKLGVQTTDTNTVDAEAKLIETKEITKPSS